MQSGLGWCNVGGHRDTNVFSFQVYYDGAHHVTKMMNSNTGSRNTVIWLGTNNGKDGNPYTFGSGWLDDFYIWQRYIPDEQFIMDLYES